MRRLFFLFLTLFLFSCAPTPQLAPSRLSAPPSPTRTSTLTPSPTLAPSATPTFAPTPIPPKVVIISVDGLRPEALLRADAPNIKALAQRGSYTWKAQTVFPPVTEGKTVYEAFGEVQAQGKINNNRPGSSPGRSF